MNNNDLYQLEKWKEIKLDTKYRYAASTLGRIMKIDKKGKKKIIKEHYHNRSWHIGLTMADGKRRKYQVITLISRTFLGNPPKGYVAIHKNGIVSDHRLSNIKYIPRGEQITSYNRYKRKPVMKIDKNAEVVMIYPSATICAEKNNFSPKAIINRCNGIYKTFWASDGFEYCYEDDSRRYDKIIASI